MNASVAANAPVEAKPRLVEQHEAAGRRVEVEGQRIFVREQGQGEPVFLLHGVPSSSFLYRKMIPLLAAEGYRAIAFDFPGVGLSDKPQHLSYDWHALARWVGWVVDTLKLPPLHLVVHDIGGPIGVEWAIEHPDRVRTITITNTLLDVASFRPPFPMWTFRVPFLKSFVMATMSPGVMLPLFRRSGVKHRDAIDRDSVESYIYLLKADHGSRSFLRIMAGFDLSEAHRDRLRDGLLRIEKPMQLVWGEHEIAIPQAQLDYIRQVFSLEEEHMVDARHFLQEDQPEACSALIAAFARKHSG